MIEKVLLSRIVPFGFHAPDNPAAVALLYGTIQLQEVRETTFTRSGYCK